MYYIIAGTGKTSVFCAIIIINIAHKAVDFRASLSDSVSIAGCSFMSRMLNKMPQVAVLLPTSVKVSRDMRRGILQYVYRNGPWGLHIIEGRSGEQKLVRMKEWGCTGIIGRLYTPELVRIAGRTDLPMVLVEPEKAFLRPGCRLARHSIVRSDTAAVGRMAAEYFLNRKFTHYAFVGEVRGVEWSVKRGKAFSEAVRAAGYDCRIYEILSKAEQKDAGLESCRWGAGCGFGGSFFGFVGERSTDRWGRGGPATLCLAARSAETGCPAGRNGQPGASGYRCVCVGRN